MSLLIGICGGTGSGKTTLARLVAERLCHDQGSGAATVISFDAYYRDQGHLSPAERAEVNYDHPDSLDGELLVEHLRLLGQGQQAPVPVYDFATHTRSAECHVVKPAEVIMVEGILLFAFRPVVEQLDYRVFRRCPEEVRFQRRIRRDRAERGRTLASVQAQLAATVKPMHDLYVEPYADLADYVTDHGDDLDTVTADIAARISDLVVNGAGDRT